MKAHQHVGRSCPICGTAINGTFCPECEGLAPPAEPDPPEGDPCKDPVLEDLGELEDVDDFNGLQLLNSLRDGPAARALLAEWALETLETLARARRAGVERMLSEMPKPLLPASDDIDNASARERLEATDALSKILLSLAERAENAIARINAGTWGYCVQCGKPISIPRLLILPDAESCVPCGRLVARR